MTGIAEHIREQITHAVAEIESEPDARELRRATQRVAHLAERLRRAVAHRDYLALQIGATVAIAAHVDALLDSVLPEPITDDAIEPERWDGLS